MPEHSEQSHKKLTFSQLANLSLAVLLLFGIAVTTYNVTNLRDYSADAAKGGNSGGKGGGKRGKNNSTPSCNTGTASVSLTSANPVTKGTTPTFYAKGYNPGDLVYMVMSGYIKADYVYADSDGTITYTFREPMWFPGNYTFTTTLLNGVNCANVSFTVQ